MTHIDAPLVGRICAEHRGAYRLQTDSQPYVAEIDGALHHRATSRLDLPAVGDYVTYTPVDAGRVRIRAIQPRRSAIVRKAAGERTDAQIIASNVDTLFIVSALDGDFNLRRLERYVILAWESNVRPVILLNKADLCDDPGAARDQIDAMGWSVPIHITSAISHAAIDELAPYLEPAQTVALAGSSGVGKSTLANLLIGEERQATGGVRSGDDRGRHTTTGRELFVLAGGAALIDTPGMRELQLWGDTSGIDQAFDDIAGLAAACRFRDCSHAEEPGCAVRAAIGLSLDVERFEQYRRLLREAAYLERRMDDNAQRLEKARWKAIHKAMRKRL